MGNDAVSLLLILADNYNQTTNGPITEAQRTHRDIFGREIRCSLHLSDPCVLPAAAPGSRRAVVAAGARVPAALVAADHGPGRPV